MLKGFSGIYLYMTTDGFMKTTYKKSKTLKLIKNTKINKKIIGYIGMWFVMDECHITNVAVLSEYRKKGIATKLIKEMLNLCKEHGTHYIMLEVRKSNLPAQKLYLKFNFTEEVIRKDYYKNPDGTREDAIVMSREL